jgi:hypothetical protein
MANWIEFITIAAKPVTLAINTDLVRIIQPGQAVHSVALDGVLVVGDFATLMLMLGHTIYPGVPSSPITAS